MQNSLTREKPSGNITGLYLSLTTAVFWGILPIALKLLLVYMDAFTITWARFLFSATCLGLFLKAKGGFPLKNLFTWHNLLLLISAAACLASNYLIYMIGLDNITPSTASVIIQLAPLFLLFGGLVFYKEPFSGKQWAGVAILILGLILFFNHRLSELLTSLTNYSYGVMLIILSGLFWTAYALIQKKLLNHFSSVFIMFFIYTCSSIFIAPLASPPSVINLGFTPMMLLIFCAVNTLVGYGCFAEALNHWDASRVSAVVATLPLITLTSMEVIHGVYPEIMKHEDINIISFSGALLVVAGSAFTALSRSPGEENHLMGDEIQNTTRGFQ